MKRILKVQEEIGALAKSADNPFFKSQYLDLNDLIQNVKPILNKHGLVLLQPIREGQVFTEIRDSETGNLIADSSLSLPNEPNPQKIGSCITYYRRYSLKSLLSIAEKDDDGNLASQDPTKNEVINVIKGATSLQTLTDWKGWISKHDLTHLAKLKAKELN